MKKIVRLQINRKQLSVVVGSLLLIGLIGYGVYAWLAWSGYQDRYQSHVSNTRTSLSKTFEKKLTNEYRAADKMNDILGVADKMATADYRRCDPPPLVGWLEVIGQLKNQVGLCVQAIDQIVQEGQEVESAAEVILLDHQIADTLRVAADKSKNSREADSWPKAHEAWVEAAANLKELDRDERSTTSSLLTRTRGAVEQIVAAWASLVESHEKNDELQYEDAKGQLSKSYQSLNALRQ